MIDDGAAHGALETLSRKLFLQLCSPIVSWALWRIGGSIWVSRTRATDIWLGISFMGVILTVSSEARETVSALAYLHWADGG